MANLLALLIARAQAAAMPSHYSPVSKRYALALVATFAGWLQTTRAIEPPTPYGPIPSVRQLEWQQLEYVGFLHFTVNTFTDREWGEGDEDEKVFNPTDFSAEQIVRTAREAGMKELVLTAKHHDGFCLWPSDYTEHSVKHAPWKEGHGDVVQEIADACRKNEMRFGVYLSPWDRNHKDYGRPGYLAYYRNQLRELLNHYGPISEVWFDGANGGTGYYGGARERRTIDSRTYYEWQVTWGLVREWQPNACMFSDVGPDIRWVGNEAGRAGETCWATLDPTGFSPGHADPTRLNRGDRPGTEWVPAECDVSIRPGWFYHTSEDGKVKTARELLDLYFASVGRGATLMLNVPPDRRGQLHETDVQALLEFKRLRDGIFAHDLAREAKATASNTRGRAAAFGPRKVTDGSRDSYWSTDDGVTSPELVLTWRKPVTFNIVRLREYLPLGQRIEAFALDRWADDKWLEFAHGTSIGNCRLMRFPSVTASKLRLRIVQAPVCLALSELSVFTGER